MLNLKLAEGYIDVYLSLSRYNSDLARVRSDLAKLPGTARIPIRADLRQWNRALVQVFTDLHRVRTMANVPITANAGAAHASLNLLLQHLKTVQSAAKINVTAGRGAGFGGGRGGYGGGMGRGASFLSGIGQGFGLGYTSNPYMLAGDALARLATAAAASSIALETQSAVLRRVAGLSAGQTVSVKGALFGLSTSPGNAASMEDLMSMATIGARMGVADKGGTKGLVEFTQGMSQLATVINDMDAGKLADEVGRSLNNFQLGTEYVKGFGSALMSLDNESIASAADLLNVTQRLSGQAHAAGLSIQETMALASVLKDVGITNEVAGTSFSQIFQKMASGSHKFAEAIGMDAAKFEDAYREGPLKALGLVIDKLATMDDTVEKMQFLDELGLKGARVSGSLLRLTAVWGELAGRIKMANKEFQTGDALTKGVAIQAATTESAGKRMSNAFRELGDALMTKANPALAGTAGLLADIAGGFAGVIKGQNDFWQQATAKQRAMAKPPERQAARRALPTDVTTEQMQAEYMASNGDIVNAKLAKQSAQERLAAAERARDDAFNKAGIREGVAPAPWQKAAVAADERLANAKLAAEQAGLKVEEAIARHRELGARLATRERENARAATKDRIEGTLGELIGGRDRLRNAMLRAGVRGVQAMDRAVHAGGKTREEILNMSDRERAEEAKRVEQETAKNTGEANAIASEMLAVLMEIRNRVGQAALGQ